MPIRINLLAEAQAAEEMRRKNPVKLGIWIAAFCVAVVLLWILKLQLDIKFSQIKYNNLEKSWNADKTNYAAVTTNEIKTADVDRKIAALDRLATNRFLWAPVLNALQQTMVDNVQVVRITGEQKYVFEDSRTEGSGARKTTHPAVMTEKITLYIDAKDYSPDAQSYNKFKERLCGLDYFVTNTGRKDGFILDGTLSTPMADAAEAGKQFVTFRLTSHFTEVPRSE
jgi:hypothetical protein